MSCINLSCPMVLHYKMYHDLPVATRPEERSDDCGDDEHINDLGAIVLGGRSPAGWQLVGGVG